MKKLISSVAVVLAIVFIFGILTGCEGNSKKTSAEDAIKNAETVLDLATSFIKKAEADGRDVVSAYYLLNQAGEWLNQAREAKSRVNYDDAIEFAEEAEFNARDAMVAAGW